MYHDKFESKMRGEDEFSGAFQNQLVNQSQEPNTATSESVAEADGVARLLPNIGTHTPGPWKVRAGTFCDDGIPSYEVVMPGSPCLNAIDARLIGKAPELYSALERTLTHLRASMAGRAHACAEEAIAEAESALDLRYKPDTNALASSGTTQQSR